MAIWSKSNGKALSFEINKFVKLNFSNTKTSLTPFARSGHRAVADDNYVWIIGGYNAEFSEHNVSNEQCPLFREFWKFNLSTHEWSLVKQDENMPHELASHSAIIQNNYLLVFGGTGVPFGEKSSNQLTTCHLPSGKWRKVKSSGTKPEKIYGQAMACVRSHLYVYGGTSGFVYNTELHRLDLNNFVWEKLKPNNIASEIPPERYRHEIACYKNQIFVFGGGTSHRVYPLEFVYVYSIDSNSWCLKSTKPDPSTNNTPSSRRCHSCVQLDNCAYICGGYNGEVILGDLWRINLEDLQWIKLAMMPEPVYFHSAAVTTEGCMVIFGGVSCIHAAKRTDSCYQVWLKVPSLQTMCWLTLIRTHPQLLKLPRRKLLQLGINQYFIKKLSRAEGA